MKHLKAWIGAWVVLSVLACASQAQDYLPVRELKLFAPADVNPLSGHPQPKEGWFATFDLLHWSIQSPNKSSIGKDGIDPLVHDVGLVRRQQNSFNSSFIGSDFVDGNRFELGSVSGHWGWFFRTFKTKSHSQTLYGSNVDVVFKDTKTNFTYTLLDPFTRLPVGTFTVPVGYLDGFVNQDPVNTVDDDQNGNFIFGRFWDGSVPPDGVVDPTDPADVLEPRNYDLGDLVRIPTNFTELSLEYSSDMWGFEVTPFRRMDQFHHGSNLEMGIGVRYLRFDDEFNIAGTGLLTNKGNVVSGGETGVPTGLLRPETTIYTDTENHIVGPQFFANWFYTQGRVSLVAQGRFFAGWNFQNIHQRGSLNQNALGRNSPFVGPQHTANNLFLTFPQDEFNHNLESREWSPGVEVEFGARYQLTRAFSASITWDGLWIAGIARSPNVVDYTLPKMGLLASENRENMFIHGLNAGLQLNR